ncbi:MAG: hypothetical protein WC260_03835 [Candidatus Pacearchaeota archaeon]
MEVTFKKRRYYKGKLREIGDVVNMDRKHARAFIRVNAVIPTVLISPIKETQQPPEPQTDHSVPQTMTRSTPNKDDQEQEGIENLPYREIQELCKKKDIPANGSRDELIQRLKEGG